jgi:alkaline phosphatase D
MKVRQLSVGPIIGETTNKTVRIFGRAKLEFSAGQPRRAHGVVRMREKGKVDFKTPRYFKMNPNFDMTGIIVLGGLSDRKSYEYQIGWIFSEVDSDEINVSKQLDWTDRKTHEFRAGSARPKDSRNIVIGSCRYVLKLFGGRWFDNRGDKTFQSILKQETEGPGVDQVIMCGDQIYADDLKFIGSDDALDEFNSRYRGVFRSKHLRSLMSRVPTYMTLDDHEIEDNWPESASDKDWVTKFPAAIHAYSTYQLSHSPLFRRSGRRIKGTPTHLWYTYEDGCCEFFVCDTRTERWLDPANREILGPRQLSSLIRWLKKDTGLVKLIVTSVPFYESESNDKWHGFIEQRDKILETIRNSNVKRVVFVSGDVHASMASELINANSPKFKVISVVSSPFFWPYPHPNRRSFKRKDAIKTGTGEKYEVQAGSKVYATDTFVRMEIDLKGVDVGFYGRKGRLLEQTSFSF